MKNVDVNKSIFDSSNNITVENNSTGFILIKYVCLSNQTNNTVRDVKIIVTKGKTLVKT